MSAAAQQRMRIANEKAMKNVTHRGNVPKGTKVEQEKYPVSPLYSLCIYEFIFERKQLDTVVPVYQTRIIPLIAVL